MITALLVIAAIVYVFGVILTAGVGAMDWATYRDLAKQSQSYPALQAGYERDTRTAARRVVQSPLWPLLALGVLVRIYADSKEA